ncbi:MULTISPECIES: hypothetical protein [Oceanobacillus]|uniref:Uncharacterized protein n=1 Tax=Oceanobacillus profundus TaxID=372463 RepID=A0A417YF10_9BACI|nr:hypothetical protein [Oceanobacillus profundus]RHW31268.1 hypothetical protein D1B32_13785 [Oceanobacillus profundus]
MEKIMEGHLVGFWSVNDLWRDDDYDFTDAGMKLRFKDELSVAECDLICEENSGHVVVKKKKPS